MTDLNEFNISEEELAEIQEITDLAQDCTDLFISLLVNPETNEIVEIAKEDKKTIFKQILDKTMEYTEEHSIPDSEDDFGKYVDFIFKYMQENLK